MYTFCDVLHETKQKNANKLLRVCNTDWKSSVIERKINFHVLVVLQCRYMYTHVII